MFVFCCFFVPSFTTNCWKNDNQYKPCDKLTSMLLGWVQSTGYDFTSSFKTNSHSAVLGKDGKVGKLRKASIQTKEKMKLVPIRSYFLGHGKKNTSNFSRQQKQQIHIYIVACLHIISLLQVVDEVFV